MKVKTVPLRDKRWMWVIVNSVGERILLGSCDTQEAAQAEGEHRLKKLGSYLRPEDRSECAA